MFQRGGHRGYSPDCHVDLITAVLVLHTYYLTMWHNLLKADCVYYSRTNYYLSEKL